MKLELKPEFRWKRDQAVRFVTRENEWYKQALISETGGKFEAYPHGGRDCEEFDSLEEAHAYLLSVGSESPFHDLDEPTAAAEGEGPVAPTPSLAEQIAQAQEAWAASAEHFRKCIDEWWSGLTPSVIMPTAPRLCAVDRLEAVGYALQVNGEDRRIDATRPGSLTVFAANVLNTGRWTAWIDGGPKTVCVYAIGDESPGLNAALESLLSKPVGAVTVAQILGVA